MGILRMVCPRRKESLLNYGLFLTVFGLYLWVFYHYLPSDENEPLTTDPPPFHNKPLNRVLNPVAYRRERSDVDTDDLVMEHVIPDYRKKRVGPGEQGAGVNLEGEEKRLGEEQMKTWFMNVVASDKISMDRSLPDNRHSECKKVKYERDLPSASVIVIFHQEAWTPLLRTVHSVINRSPPHLLHEVVLFDDASTRDELGEKLEKYVKRFGKLVKLVRIKERQGLIRAKIKGAEAASGEVLIFLDSHCEANTGWLEPILKRIKDKRSAVLVPAIDGISASNMGYPSVTTNVAVGGFTWSLFFTWFDRPADQGKSKLLTVPSPTMPGGLFAAERKFFFEIGAYDPGMDIWGGENLELSFRTWQCGGSLEMVPCSRVGHIFRSGHPYNMTNEDVHGHNSARLAEVWLGDYKRMYYRYRRELQTAKIGDISARHAIKKNLKCKDFRWYLDNVYPEKRIPDEDVSAFGMLKNPTTMFCLDSLQRREKSRIKIGVYPCQSGASMAQFFSLNPKNEMFREDECLEDSGGSVIMDGCTGGRHQMWTHDKTFFA